MTKKLEIYKCEKCNNIVEILHEGIGELFCCGKEMAKEAENMAYSDNLHYAILENLDELTKKITLKHPMTDEHHLEFIEAISNDGKYVKRKFLQNTENPELIFRCECKNGFYIRVYCNKDGLWTTK